MEVGSYVVHTSSYIAVYAHNLSVTMGINLISMLPPVLRDVHILIKVHNLIMLNANGGRLSHHRSWLIPARPQCT